MDGITGFFEHICESVAFHIHRTSSRLHGRAIHPFRHSILLWSVWVASLMYNPRRCEEIIHALAAVFFTTVSSQALYCFSSRSFDECHEVDEMLAYLRLLFH